MDRASLCLDTDLRTVTGGSATPRHRTGNARPDPPCRSGVSLSGSGRLSDMSRRSAAAFVDYFTHRPMTRVRRTLFWLQFWTTPRWHGLAAAADPTHRPIGHHAAPPRRRLATAPDGHTRYPMCDRPLGHTDAPRWACTRVEGHSGPCALEQIATELEVLDKQAPHCDDLVLHAPGRCIYCDARPDLQHNRERACVSFTGDELRDGWAPCPSERHRSAAVIDRWPGNRAYSDRRDVPTY